MYGQRYAVDGTTIGGEFLVDTFTPNFQISSSVTALADGGFVVTWSSFGQDGSDWGVYGQRFGANGTAVGGGNDTYVVDNTGDAVVELAGQGTDTIRTSLNPYSRASLANVENLIFTGAGDFVGTGNGQANTITGGSGNDTLDGGVGVDRLVGGAGNDTYIIDNTGDIVTETAGNGTDAVIASSASYTLSGNVENLTFIGAGNFAGTGNGLDNVMTVATATTL